MIVDHATMRTMGEYGEEPCKQVQCTRCGTRSPYGRDMHEAVTKARGLGFGTIPGPDITDPRSWLCRVCLAAK